MPVEAGYFMASPSPETKLSSSLARDTSQTGKHTVTVLGETVPTKPALRFGKEGKQNATSSLGQPLNLLPAPLLSRVFILSVSEDTVRERLTQRRVDPTTGER